MSQQSPSTSLYVGDLDNEVSESVLFDVFRDVGPVLSIRVCRDASTRRSLGYAYVNFQNPIDAERAIETLNHTKIKGKTCRIMWCHRDPSLRKSGTGNVFIKNLAPDIDNKALYDTFEKFGPILSCKVVVDEKTEESKGYGFVHFHQEESADKAVRDVNGMLLNHQQVYVGKFERKDKKLQSLNDTFTNVYVKHFDPSIGESKLKEFFATYGDIQSFSMQTNNDGESKGVAFVNYQSHEQAQKALEANDTTPEGIIQEGKKLVVVRHQKKGERDHQKRQSIKEKQQQFLKYTNLYVKNLDDSVNSDTLRDAFSEYGKIMSCKVMTHSDSDVSKGFGFVCFKESEQAKEAMSAMNGRMLSGKPLYVTLAQKKDARKAQLEMLYRNGRGAGLMMGGAGGGGNMMGGMGQVPFMAPNIGAFGGFNGQQPQAGGFSGYPGMGGQSRMQMGMGAGQRQMPGMPGQQMMRPPQGRQGFPPLQQGGLGAPRQHPAQNRMPAMPAMQSNRAPGMPPMSQPSTVGRSAPEVDPAGLATMAQDAQKNFLGEKLFAKISATEATNAAKITGMLLEMDNAEILNLLESANLLQIKVQEAMAVLRNHGH